MPNSTEFGDNVRHIDPTINNGLIMTVNSDADDEDQKFLCSDGGRYLDTELILVAKGKEPTFI